MSILSNRSCKTNGFTLIELLVVIAIISLLVSILLPSLTKAKDLAKQMACGTQLRAIDLALRLYAEDNNGHYPLGGLANEVPNRPSTHSKLTWYEMLCHRYSWSPPGYGLTYPDSFKCPGEEVGFGLYMKFYHYTHYGANYWIMDIGDPEYKYHAIDHPTNVYQPSLAVLVFDNGMKHLPGTCWTGHTEDSALMAFRHMDTANFLYLDGHIDSMDFATLIEHGTSLKYGIEKPKRQK